MWCMITGVTGYFTSLSRADELLLRQIEGNGKNEFEGPCSSRLVYPIPKCNTAGYSKAMCAGSVVYVRQCSESKRSTKREG